MAIGLNDTPADRIRHLECGCREDAVTGLSTHFCPDHAPFVIDIDAARRLIAEWGLIAQSIARQCKWRPRGKCLVDCQGLAVCNLEGLTLVNLRGDPAGRPEPGGLNVSPNP